MKLVINICLLLLISFLACSGKTPEKNEQENISINRVDSIPQRNKQIIDTVIKYGPVISPTYKKAVCTELIIPIIEKFYKLNKTDKNRIRIITNEDIHILLREDSPIPKGVYYALSEKSVGTPIDSLHNVLPGDLVQFWTETWGHCGIVKSINSDNRTMELYSSFQSTDGYGIQLFPIPKHSFFVRLK